ncbi:MAG: DPP IV N-terminal domain-containing protein [Bacteroidales bacterium]|nr:DPP IV N-terminal domain-containing protein [Bacteroidales bacterium]MCF8338228.1 DPP IV N-terminal domain-containing protein [Bacteroidales bacterium]
MKKTALLILIILLCFPALTNADKTKPYARMPALNSDGTKVLFAYQGDVWVVNTKGGEAKRLTAHRANDTKPAWAPDNESIAFSSDRYGNYDVYILPLDGQPLKRLTHHSEDDILSSWKKEKLYFTSERIYPQVEREDEMMTINEDGGTPSRFVDALGYEPVPSPDGRFMAFVRGSCRTAREDYRGAANRDIWIYDRQAKEFHQATTFDGHDFNPRWKNDSTLLFISARKGTYNIHKLGPDENGIPSVHIDPVTAYEDEGIRNFSLNEQGDVIAFERKTSLFIKEEGNEPRRLSISMPTDQLMSEKEFKVFKKKSNQFKVSPDANYIAFLVRGNLFLKLNHKEGEFSRGLVKGSSRVKSFDWLDNNTLIYTADKDDQYDLFRVEAQKDKKLMDSHKFDHRRLTETPKDESQPVVSPDRKKIAFRRGTGGLLTADIKDNQLKNEQKLLEGWAKASHISWSPDNQWLAYSKRDLNGNREVFIHKADNSKEPVNVSLHPRSDSHPVWSHDKLTFLSERNNNSKDVWFVWLNEKDWQRTRREWKKLELIDSTAVDTSDIQIDFDNIHERITQVTGLPGNESDLQVTPDGKTFYFVTNRDDRRHFDARNHLYSIRWDGKKLKPILQGKKTPYSVKLGPDNQYLYMLLKGGKLARVSPDKKKLKPQPFEAKMEIDYNKQREQVFDEAWRSLDKRFYDPDFHGKDWQELKETYKPRAMAASTNRTFQYTFNLMLGQVNASHMGLRNVKERYDTPDFNTGLLGIDINPTEEGIEVKHVLEGTPAAREESLLEKGDVITHVDGRRVHLDKNFYEPLNNKVNQQVLLTVNRNGEEKEIVISPAKSINKELYKDWVETRKQLTEEYSNGKLGYIHIRGMNWNSFERFERELAATAYDKEGLVIDVRFNGGGWTTDYLMAILDVRQHAYTIPRGAADNLAKEHKKFSDHYPFGERLPFYPWTKPSVTLCNQNSYSNAEIFSHAFKTLDLGKLVGTPTFGAVISTGAERLVDGSYVRIPFRAWYVKKTGKNMEHNGAVPDIIKHNAPDSKAKGEDPQLKKAVQQLLNETEEKR